MMMTLVVIIDIFFIPIIIFIRDIKLPQCFHFDTAFHSFDWRKAPVAVERSCKTKFKLLTLILDKL